MIRPNEFSIASKDGLYLYTKGGEFSLNGIEYIGEYHLEGIVFKTGPVPTKESQTLHRLYPIKDHYDYDRVFKFKVPILDFIEPVPILYRPQDQAYTSGFDTRYFVEKVDDEQSYCIEIGVGQYDQYGRSGGIDAGLYAAAKIRWQLTGRRDDILANNELELYKASSKLPTITYAVRNYLEFARITLV